MRFIIKLFVTRPQNNQVQQQTTIRTRLFSSSQPSTETRHNDQQPKQASFFIVLNTHSRTDVLTQNLSLHFKYYSKAENLLLVIQVNDTSTSLI